MTLARTRRFLLAAAPALMLAVPGLSLAQPRCISPATVQSASITDAQRQEIQRCVEQQKAGLSSEDPKAIQRARDQLEQALLEPGVSISFRIEYTRQLLPVLNDLAKNQRDIVAANALHLAGELATPAASDLLRGAALGTGLRDPRAAVRYAAAYGLKRTFEQVEASSSVFQVTDAENAIKDLGAAIAAEKEPHVLEGFARAMDAAAAISDSKLRGVRVAAVRVLATEMGKRAQAATTLEIGPALIRSGQVLRDTMTDPQEPRLPDAVLKEVGAYGGDLLAIVSRVLKGPDAAGTDRGELAAVVATGENAVFFAASNLGRSQEQDPSLVQSVRSGNDAAYFQAADKIIGAKGVLTQPPFGLPAKRFETK